LARGGNAPALAFEGAWRSWAWLKGFADALDARLAQAGLADATVALVARNRPHHVASLAAQIASHRTTAMIYAAQSPAGIAAEIGRIGLPVILADIQDWTAEAVAAARASGIMGLVIADDATQPVRPVVGLEAPRQGFTPRDPAMACELLSSGTTGLPKRLPLSWAALESATADARIVYAGTSVRDAPLVMIHPLGNVAGMSYLAPPLAYGQRIVLLERFSVAAWRDAMVTYRPVRTALPAAAIQMVLQAGVPAEDLASLTLVAVGGSKLDVDLQLAFEARYGIPVLIAFGATEFGGVVANWTLDLHHAKGAEKRGSAGRASPNVELRIVDAAGFEPAPPGTIGLLEAKVGRIGPHWIRTNDLASLDDEGFLFVHGRADAAINRGGFKVVPEVVANALRQHPSVADAAVVGLPDQRLGAVPVAAVELRRGAPPVSAEELLAHSRERLLAYERPTQILVVDALPRNASMKISGLDVRALFTQADLSQHATDGRTPACT
jgi:acyl-CoA synthetase (AMP-forming)/AMP-acid ligase II